MTLVPPLAASLLCIALLGCSPQPVSNAGDDAGPTSVACDPDGSMPEIKACPGDDLAREQARMRQYLDAAMERAREDDEASVQYGPRTRKAAGLSQSQQDWQAYAESRCAVWLPDGSGGTTGGLFYSECLTQATYQRTHDIWSDYLTFMSDSTPPVLPEPVRVTDDSQAG